MTQFKFALEVIAGAVGFLVFTGLLLTVLILLSDEARPDGVEWVTGTVGGESVNILRNSVGPVTWTTGTIGDDTVNLLENEVTDEASWTSGTVGDERVDIYRFGWDDPDTDDDYED